MFKLLAGDGITRRLPTFALPALTIGYKNQKKYFGNNSMISLIRATIMETGKNPFVSVYASAQPEVACIAPTVSNTTFTTTITG